MTTGQVAIPSSTSPVAAVKVRQAGAVLATLLSFGTNRLVGRSARWLRRNGLVHYVLPLLLLNEGFGAYRAYVAGTALGWW